MDRITRSKEDMMLFAKAFLRELRPTPGKATVMGLFGQLGAGKTTFTQGLAQALNIKEFVTSPTFVIEKIYPLEGAKWKRLVHIDAYRLIDGKDMDILRWNERARDPDNLIVVEWPERIADLLPPELVRLTFTYAGKKRIVSYQSRYDIRV